VLLLSLAWNRRLSNLLFVLFLRWFLAILANSNLNVEPHLLIVMDVFRLEMDIVDFVMDYIVFMETLRKVFLRTVKLGFLETLMKNARVLLIVRIMSIASHVLSKNLVDGVLILLRILLAYLELQLALMTQLARIGSLIKPIRIFAMDWFLIALFTRHAVIARMMTAIDADGALHRDNVSSIPKKTKFRASVLIGNLRLV